MFTPQDTATMMTGKPVQEGKILPINDYIGSHTMTWSVQHNTMTARFPGQVRIKVLLFLASKILFYFIVLPDHVG